MKMPNSTRNFVILIAVALIGIFAAQPRSEQPLKLEKLARPPTIANIELSIEVPYTEQEFLNELVPFERFAESQGLRFKIYDYSADIKYKRTITRYDAWMVNVANSSLYSSGIYIRYLIDQEIMRIRFIREGFETREDLYRISDLFIEKYVTAKEKDFRDITNTEWR